MLLKNKLVATIGITNFNCQGFFMNIKPLVKDFIKPEYKRELSGGMDIYFQEDVELTVGKDNVINLGFCAEVPEFTYSSFFYRYERITLKKYSRCN